MQADTSNANAASAIGVDEVGRGCLYGSVTAAAVVLPAACPDGEDKLWAAIRDSKKVSEKRRPTIAEFIKRVAVTWGVGWASREEIDAHNILQATMLAMHRAIDDAWRRAPAGFAERGPCILVDGTYFTPYMPPGRDADALAHTCVPKGDDKIKSIAAASILAKVARDTWVLAQVAGAPELAVYDLEKNKGYGTPAHLAAIRRYGVQDGHRRSFEPIRGMMQALAPEEEPEEPEDA